MNSEEIIDILTDLAQLDIDAVFAYEQALEKIDEQTIYGQIALFRNDHLRHIEELSQLIRQYGGVPPEGTKDFKGFFIEGFTALRSVTGTHGALKAMESNEKTTNKNYRQALEDHQGYPADVLTVLQRNYADEQRHLSYIQTTLEKWDVEHTV